MEIIDYETEENFGTPSQLLDYLIEYTEKNDEIKKSLNDFKESEIWSKSDLENQTESKKIVLKLKAKDKLAKLCLNQLDSQGVFYYQPSKGLSETKYDLSYIIQLEDMITLKIDEKFQDSNNLVELLKKNRIVSLTENFSDRLLNIMGNFFSKIGTNDVMSDEIMDLYVKSYPDSFFLTKGSFDTHMIRIKNVKS